MGVRRGQGTEFLHGEGSSELPSFLARRRCPRRRRRGHHNCDNCCMVCRGGRHVPDHSCDFSDDSHDDISFEDHQFSGIVKRRRKRLLDDALFEFFSKEAIKSMKRDFSNFCSCSDVWKENKKANLSGIDKLCFTVYSFKYFFEVLHRLTVEQKCAIQRFGFGCLLGLAKTHIPSSFILWLACCVDYHSSQIIVDDKIINISKDSFHFVLGLPNSGSEVVEDSEGGADFIMSLFHLSEVPHITFFGDVLKSTKPLSDEHVFVCFMQIAISCFLCPSANDRLDTKYIKQLGDFDRASSFDICQLVYNHFILGVEKLLRFIKVKGRKPKSFEFCSFALAYLDCLDFGAHIVGSGVPRAVSWNGDMIVEYSELDRRSKRCFGRRRMRSDLPSVYVNRMFKSNMDGMNCGTSCEPMSEQVKQSFHDKFGMILDGKAPL